jgi:enoyl-CoA hydratase
MSEYGLIDVSLENGVFTIEIGGLDADTHRGISRSFRAAHESEEARVVVVTGKDRSFLNPDMYDVEWVAASAEPSNMRRMLKEAEDIIRDSIGCEKPTIAKVFAPGAHSLGASVALACDFVYAADDATFSDPHLSGFAVTPGDGGALFWPARIGLTRAREFLMTDKSCTAAEAVDIGLINKAVPADALDGEVDALVQKLLSYDPLALNLTKKWINQYVQHDLATVGLGALAAEGIRLAQGSNANPPIFQDRKK